MKFESNAICSDEMTFSEQTAASDSANT